MEWCLKKKLAGGKFKGVSTERSRLMAGIRGKNNKSTEIRFRMILMRARIRGWKLHGADLPGKPDFYFPRRKLAIFVDGCFWHGCPKCYRQPTSNVPFWKLKIQRNRDRDLAAVKDLKDSGWKAIRIWECDLKSGQKMIGLVKRMI